MARRRRWAGGGGRIFMDRFAIEGQVFGNVADGLATLPSGLNLGIALGPKDMARSHFGRLLRRRRTDFGAIATHHFDTRMGFLPLGHGLHGTIGQTLDDLSSFQIHDHRGVAMALAQGPVVDTDDLWGLLGWIGQGSDHA